MEHIYHGEGVCMNSAAYSQWDGGLYMNHIICSICIQEEGALCICIFNISDSCMKQNRRGILGRYLHAVLEHNSIEINCNQIPKWTPRCNDVVTSKHGPRTACWTHAPSREPTMQEPRGPVGAIRKDCGGRTMGEGAQGKKGHWAGGLTPLTLPQRWCPHKSWRRTRVSLYYPQYAQPRAGRHA